ncbi:mixed lineage kinase domain-like protein isoform X2 [Perca fluviatilis]|uniref:mixed lineage kinase domain-like protein isoform X2 n=1 Tax=Perca fluviatilis TaxID=8168 RepID=UPI001965C8D0|nr:mixed lineage kinase domain-like protein isoform X2 [Perca fluviatilis]
MDCIDPILLAASTIYNLVENVKANKKQCKRVGVRVKALEHVVKSIRTLKQGQTSADVEKTLQELKTTLDSATVVIEKFTKSTWVDRVLKSSSHQDEFHSLNDRLNDAFQVLSLNLAVEQKEMLFKVFDQTSREKEDEADRKEDNTELERLLKEHHKEMFEKLEAMQREVESIGVNVEKIVANLKKPSITEEAIRKIKPDELTYTDFPKVPFIKTETSEVYKGTYRHFPVAIKRYTETLNTSVRLHHTEDQSKVHGSINSSKFLVSEGYVVKLGGFELAKTETSLKKTTKANAHGSLAYSSPQMLLDINYKYSKECEIYSFGIVMWEVATRNKPYEGWSNKDFLEKVGKQKYQQPLPDDCPKPLRDLINACLAHDRFERPSAGELVDKLQTALEKIEE